MSDSVLVAQQDSIAVSVQVPEVITIGINRGEKGDRGLDGVNGTSATGYDHTQSQMSTAWLILHNLNRIPIIQSFDFNGSEIHGTIVNHPPYNVSTIVFAIPVSGSARLI